MKIRVHKGNLDANAGDGGNRPVVLLNLGDAQVNVPPFRLLDDAGREILRIGYRKYEKSVWIETPFEHMEPL